MASRPRYKAPTEDQKRIADLESKLKESEARYWVAHDQIKGMKTQSQFQEAIGKAMDIGRESGWKQGVADALIPQSPDHPKALAYINS